MKAKIIIIKIYGVKIELFKNSAIIHSNSQKEFDLIYDYLISEGIIKKTYTVCENEYHS